jgi:hypothetical protein
MTPKQKAEELIEEFADYSINLFDENLNLTPIIAAKKCALIAVDECLKILNVWSAFNMPKSSQVIFYEEVKQEIEKL